MAFTLADVVPWGRSLAEYRAMFALSPRDLAGRVLGCGDGPASFQAEARPGGARVVSCDPLYRFSAAQIEERIRETYPTVLDQLSSNRETFVWRDFHSPEQLGEVRVFPLLDLWGRLSPHLEPVMSELRREGRRVRREPVGYEFQRGAREMLRAMPPGI